MPWSKVEKAGSGRGTAEPMISLRKSGSIGVNNQALEEYFDDDIEQVELYFDEENNRIGIKPVKEGTEDSYKLSVTDSGGSITPMSFLNSHDLVPDITTQYEPETEKLNGDTELVAVDLDEPIGTYGSPAEEKQEEE